MGKIKNIVSIASGLVVGGATVGAGAFVAENPEIVKDYLKGNAIYASSDVEEIKESHSVELKEIEDSHSVEIDKVNKELNSTKEELESVKNSVNGVISLTDLLLDNFDEELDLSKTELETIPAYLFKDLKSLKTIKLPSTLKKIETYAFSGCSSLENVEFPEGCQLETVNAYAFNNCESLKSIDLSKVLYLDGNTFENCKSLVSVNLGSLKYVNSHAFNGCINLETVENLEYSSISSVVSNTFSGCSKLNSIRIPETVTSIGSYAFNGCAITSFIVPNNVKTISTYAFKDCIYLVEIYNLSSLTIAAGSTGNGDISKYAKIVHTSLEEESIISSVGDFLFCEVDLDRTLFKYVGQDSKISLPSDVEPYSVGIKVFYESNVIEEVTISEAVISIGERAFSKCSNLKKVNISDSVTYIGKNAFSSCYMLDSAIISENSVLNTIDTSAFSGCHKLYSIVLPSSLTTISSSAFSSCTSLVEIYNLSSLDIQAGATTFGNVAANALVVHNSMDEASIISVIDDFRFGIKDNIAMLLSYSGNSSVVTLPDIGKEYSVSSYAFEYNNIIESVEIPEYVIDLGSCFYYCDNLKSVEFSLNSQVKEIKGLFPGCSSLSTVVLPSSLESIGSYTFEKCVSLKSILIPASVKTIASSAFAESGFEHINFEESSQLESIGSSAFANSLNLIDIVIPANVSSIGKNAFEGCKKLELVKFEDGSKLEVVNYKVFLNCSSLKKVYFGANSCLSGIEGDAFNGCNSLSTIIVPATLSYVVLPNNCFVDVIILEGTCSLSSSFGSMITIYVPNADIDSYTGKFTSATLYGYDSLEELLAQLNITDYVISEKVD